MTTTLSDMNMSRLLLAGLLGAALTVFPSPGSAQQSQDATTLDEVQTEFSEAFAAIGELTADQRDEVLSRMEATLERLDKQVEQTETRVRDEWSDMTEATRERTSAALKELRERRNRLSEAYGALSQGTATAWGDLMSGIQSGWADLERAWNDAATAMSDDTTTGE